MDQSPPKKQKKNSESAFFSDSKTEYKVFTREQTNTKINLTKKLIGYHYYKGSYPSNPTSSSFGNSSSHGERHIFMQKPENASNFKSKGLKECSLEESIIYPDDCRVHGATRKEHQTHIGDGVEVEIGDNNEISRLEEIYEENEPGVASHHRNPSKQVSYQNRVFNIADGSSYICEPINQKREPVIINDQVVKDNLVLCCKPRREKHIYAKSNHEGGGTDNIDRNIPPQTEEEIKEHFFDEKNSMYRESPNYGQQILGYDSPVLKTSTFLQEKIPSIFAGKPERSEAERKTTCSKLTKRFTCYLWTLFYISMFLFIVGWILLIHTVLHFINKKYINLVIDEPGFIFWLWVVLVLSILIIILGIFGMYAAIDRRRKSLVIFSIKASILALIIMIFLLLQWVLYIHMKDVKHRAMKHTMKMYRCDRTIRNAWDDLQEIYKCCGIESKNDWKYIPPSCCNGTTKQQKMECVKHYITEQQAFSNGCRAELQNYFFTFFFIAACLLLLALILMVIGILACLWLLERYKKVEKCQEVCYVSR